MPTAPVTLLIPLISPLMPLTAPLIIPLIAPMILLIAPFIVFTMPFHTFLIVFPIPVKTDVTALEIVFQAPDKKPVIPVQTETAVSLMPFQSPTKKSPIAVPTETKKSLTAPNAVIHHWQMLSQFIQSATAMAISAPIATMIMPIGFAVRTAFKTICATVHIFVTTLTTTTIAL